MEFKAAIAHKAGALLTIETVDLERPSRHCCCARG